MSPNPSQLQKAFLETESGARIDCMFNPSKFSFTTSNRWESDKVPGLASPSMRYAGGDGGTFDLSLVFDTTGTPLWSKPLGLMTVKFISLASNLEKLHFARESCCKVLFSNPSQAKNWMNFNPQDKTMV